MELIFDREDIPVVNENKRYWFIRTYRGEAFSDYYDKDYVGLGINDVPTQLIKSVNPDDLTNLRNLHNFLNNNTSYKDGAATRAARQLIEFENIVKVGDTIVIPSKNSTRLAIGTVTSDVYAVRNTGTFYFENELHHYPQRRRKVEWDRKVFKDDLQGDLRPLIASQNGLTNADSFADTIDGTVKSLYIKDKHIYLTLKINQDEDINAFVLNRFLTGLTYFYQEYCKENGEEVNEDLTIKIKLQSKGKVAMRAFGMAGLIGLAGMVALSNNNEVEIDFGKVKVKGKSDGLIQSVSNFLDKRQERRIEWEKFNDSMQRLKAKPYTDSLRTDQNLADSVKKEGE